MYFPSVILTQLSCPKMYTIFFIKRKLHSLFRTLNPQDSIWHRYYASRATFDDMLDRSSLFQLLSLSLSLFPCLSQSSNLLAWPLKQITNITLLLLLCIYRYYHKCNGISSKTFAHFATSLSPSLSPLLLGCCLSRRRRQRCYSIGRGCAGNAMENKLVIKCEK